MSGPNADKIQNLFSEIASSYDSANDAITFGMARSWRKKLVRWSEASKTSEILDIATGTGDLAFDFFDYTQKQAKVTGVDFCEPMLEKAKDKATARLAKIDFKWGDACSLDFADASFDIVSISYGIRNVEDLDKAVTEFHRVLRPGGRLMILETGSKDSGILSPFVHFYSSYIMPIVGGIASGKKSAYKYLGESSSQFPSGKNLIYRVQNASKFSKAESKKILGGASFIYKFVK